VRKFSHGYLILFLIVNKFSRYKGQAFHPAKRYTINKESCIFHTLGQGLVGNGYWLFVNGVLLMENG
jgi:hypothetical protein